MAKTCRKTFAYRTYAKIAELARPRANSDTRGRVKIAELARPRANSDTRGRVSLLKMNSFA